MKILGLSKKNHNTFYIVEIGHEEVKKVMDKSYYGKTLDELKVDAEFDITAGYNYLMDIVDAVNKMAAGYEAFVKASAIMAEFTNLLPRKEL